MGAVKDEGWMNAHSYKTGRHNFIPILSCWFTEIITMTANYKVSTSSFQEEQFSLSILWKQILKILHFSKCQACLFLLWQILINPEVATFYYVNVPIPGFGNKCRQWIGNMIWAGKVRNVLDLQHLKTNLCEVSGPKVQPSMQTSYQH